MSRKLLKRTRKGAPEADLPVIGHDSSPDRQEARIRALEENERRQAELRDHHGGSALAAHAWPPPRCTR